MCQTRFKKKENGRVSEKSCGHFGVLRRSDGDENDSRRSLAHLGYFSLMIGHGILALKDF